jgi:hypothetical protein
MVILEGEKLYGGGWWIAGLYLVRLSVSTLLYGYVIGGSEWVYSRSSASQADFNLVGKARSGALQILGLEWDHRKQRSRVESFRVAEAPTFVPVDRARALIERHLTSMYGSVVSAFTVGS